MWKHSAEPVLINELGREAYALLVESWTMKAILKSRLPTGETQDTQFALYNFAVCLDRQRSCALPYRPRSWALIKAFS